MPLWTKGTATDFAEGTSILRHKGTSVIMKGGVSECDWLYKEGYFFFFFTMVQAFFLISLSE